MLFDYAETTSADIYKLMAQSVIPRPIAWVVTEKEGIVNAAPFSYFTPLSSHPAAMIVSIGHKSDGTPKDTLQNLRETGKCTVCITTPEHLSPMHFSSKELEANISEAAHFDIPLSAHVVGYPPMVAGTPVAFACDFHSEVALEGSKTVPVVLQIRYQFVDDRCLKDREHLVIDFEALARVGKSYARLGEPLSPPDIP